MSSRFDPSTYAGLDRLGRVSLSKSFHMREFLYSEVAVHLALRNVPENVDAAVHAGRQLCERLLEPLQDAFGRVHVRSGYRSQKVNEAGVEKYSCARDNDGFHVWDRPTTAGHGAGAVACLSIPSVSKRVLTGKADDLAIAWWIVDHLPDWSFLEFFATHPHSDEVAFNIGWHERPFKTILTWRDGPRDRSNLIPGLDERKRLWESLTVEGKL
jgi:hypothetical protein